MRLMHDEMNIASTRGKNFVRSEDAFAGRDEGLRGGSKIIADFPHRSCFFRKTRPYSV
jgi:hypothetical protein